MHNPPNINLLVFSRMVLCQQFIPISAPVKTGAFYKRRLYNLLITYPKRAKPCGKRLCRKSVGKSIFTENIKAKHRFTTGSGYLERLPSGSLSVIISFIQSFQNPTSHPRLLSRYKSCSRLSRRRIFGRSSWLSLRKYNPRL